VVQCDAFSPLQDVQAPIAEPPTLIRQVFSQMRISTSSDRREA